MSDSERAVVVAPQTFPTPILIERASPSTRKKFFEFFTVPIRNPNTRAAYYRAIQQFLTWCECAGYQHLEDIEPITVAAYIEILQRRAAPPTVKQHIAAIRMLFSWLTEMVAKERGQEAGSNRPCRPWSSTPVPVFSPRSTAIVSRPLSTTRADRQAVMMGDVVAHDHRH